MKKSSVEIYGLAVCFVTLLCIIIALGVGIYDLLQITYPEFTLSAYEYERHQSNDSFRNSPRSGSYVQWSAPPSRGKGPGDEKTYKFTHRGVQRSREEDRELPRTRPPESGRIATVACSEPNADKLAKVWRWWPS